MKIGQNPEIPASATPSVAKAGTGAPATPSAKAVVSPAVSNPASGPGVPVTVSTMARSLQISGPSPASFDAKKVAAVRSAIEAGTYRVDAEAIADKLLANAQQVLRKSRD